MAQRKQKTFNVDGHKITVTVTRKTYMHSNNGFKMHVVDNRGNELKIPHYFVLEANKAIEKAYFDFVEKYGDPKP